MVNNYKTAGQFGAQADKSWRKGKISQAVIS